MLLDQRVRRVEIFTVDFQECLRRALRRKLSSTRNPTVVSVGLGGSLPEEAAAAVASRKRDRLLR